MGSLNKVLTVVCLVMLTCLVWLFSVHSHLKDDNKQLKSDNARQSAIIARQSFEFSRFNQIATTAHRYGIQADAKAQEKIIEYRTLLKKESVCDGFVPQPVADGLLEYTSEIRARAMRTDTRHVNEPRNTTLTPRQ